MSPLISSVPLEGAMADNSTHPFVDILESFGLSKIFYHLYKLCIRFSFTYMEINLQYYIVLSALYCKKSGERKKKNAVSSLLGELIFQQKCRQ